MTADKLKNEIYWDILILMLLASLIIGPQKFSLLSMAYYAWLILRNRGKLWIPKVPGMQLYIVFILYGTIIGIGLYSFRIVLRDLYYILPTLIWIFIGYHLRMKNMNGRKDLLKTLYLYGGIISLQCLVAFILHPAFDFDSLRSIFGSSVYEVGFILPIMIMEVFLFKERIFSKRVDRFLIIVMTIKIILSFGRIALLQPIIVLCIVSIFIAKYKQEKRVFLIRIASLFGVLLLLYGLVFYTLPDNTLNVFIEKFSKSFTEIDSNQIISSTGEAMNNWRAYEVQAAQKQWRDSTFIVQIFGAGIGKGIYIGYVPYTWVEVIVDHEIPILHNGFYSLLPKGGVVAVLALLLMIVGTAIKGIKFVRRGGLYLNNGIILSAVSIATIASTYVIRGPVQQGAFFIWAILIGWMSVDEGGTK